jgi:hypothetical protein
MEDPKCRYRHIEPQAQFFILELMLRGSACGKPAEKRCSRCKLEWYCSRFGNELLLAQWFSLRDSALSGIVRSLHGKSTKSCATSWSPRMQRTRNQVSVPEKRKIFCDPTELEFGCK